MEIEWLMTALLQCQFDLAKDGANTSCLLGLGSEWLVTCYELFFPIYFYLSKLLMVFIFTKQFLSRTCLWKEVIVCYIIWEVQNIPLRPSSLGLYLGIWGPNAPFSYGEADQVKRIKWSGSGGLESTWLIYSLMGWAPTVYFGSLFKDIQSSVLGKTLVGGWGSWELHGPA